MKLITVLLAFALACSAVALATEARWGVGPLRNLANLREGVKRLRVSSYDRTGGNRDFLFNIEAGKKATLAEIQGAGTITHIWVTISSQERYHLRRIVLRG